MKYLIWLVLVVTQNAWAVDGAPLGFLGLCAVLMMITVAALPFILVSAVICAVLFFIWKKFISKIFADGPSLNNKEDADHE